MEKHIVLRSDQIYDCWLKTPIGKIKVRVQEIHSDYTKGDRDIKVLIPEKNWTLWVSFGDLEAFEDAK